VILFGIGPLLSGVRKLKRQFSPGVEGDHVTESHVTVSRE